MTYVLLGSGVAVFMLVLIWLQVRFWRQGDRRGFANSCGRMLTSERIDNPRLRNVWESLEETRRLMERKQEEADERARKDAKQRLGLPAEEEILFMEEPSRLSTWPIAVLSAFVLFASRWSQSGGVFSFACLFAGLGGLLFLSAGKGRIRYFLTNFRVLVRRKPYRGSVRWSALHYGDVNGYSTKNALAGSTVALEAAGRSIDISGLSRAQTDRLLLILAERLSADPRPTS